MSGRKKTVASMAVPMALLGDIRHLIDSARERAAAAVNSQLTLLYWRIDNRIHTQVLAGKRAEYGEEIVATLSQQLGWSHEATNCEPSKGLDRNRSQIVTGSRVGDPSRSQFVILKDRSGLGDLSAPLVRSDLIDGCRFYEMQAEGVGAYLELN